MLLISQTAELEANILKSQLKKIKSLLYFFFPSQKDFNVSQPNILFLGVYFKKIFI